MLCLWIQVLLFSFVSIMAHAEDLFFIEQEVIREQARGQSVNKGLQRLWFDSRRIRNEMLFGEHLTVTVIDLDLKKILFFPFGKKQVIEMDLAQYQKLVAQRVAAAGVNDPEDKVDFKKTSKSRKILDGLCSQYLFEQSGSFAIHAEIWACQDTPVDFEDWWKLMRDLGLHRSLGRLGDKSMQIKGVPLEMRVQQIMSGQEMTTTVRVKKIARVPAEKHLFEVPTGYERLRYDGLDSQGS
jgi:hypothetical protein